MGLATYWQLSGKDGAYPRKIQCHGDQTAKVLRNRNCTFQRGHIQIQNQTANVTLTTANDPLTIAKETLTLTPPVTIPLHEGPALVMDGYPHINIIETPDLTAKGISPTSFSRPSDQEFLRHRWDALHMSPI